MLEESQKPLHQSLLKSHLDLARYSQLLWDICDFLETPGSSYLEIAFRQGRISSRDVETEGTLLYLLKLKDIPDFPLDTLLETLRGYEEAEPLAAKRRVIEMGMISTSMPPEGFES